MKATSRSLVPFTLALVVGASAWGCGGAPPSANQPSANQPSASQPSASQPSTSLAPAAHEPTTVEPGADVDAGDAAAPARAELTASECEASGGAVVGDIGDGAVHRPDYRCASGVEPTGSIRAPEGGPLGVEGSVCCPP